MSVIEVTDETFAKEVLESDIPVLVDYWADWCAPCKQLSPIIDELAESLKGKVKVVKLDTNANPVTPADHFVRGLPTLQVFVNGEMVDAMQGAKPKTAIMKALQDHI